VSLEPELGKSTGHRWLHYGWFSNVFAHTYNSPKLYSGNTCLLLGDTVATDNIKEKLHGRPVAGILGMDCLRHYCIQLDFTAKKVRFLDPESPPRGDLGQTFPLVYDWGDLETCMDFCDEKTWFGVDTGDYLDGTLRSSLLERVIKTQKPAKIIAWQNQSGASQRDYYFSTLALGGSTYTNVVIHKNSNGINANTLGVRFLARSLVTFNFPKQTMYLKQTSVGPLAQKSLIDDIPRDSQKSAPN
jgi:hypothetical protein